MANYDKKTYFGFILQGKLRDAVEYLRLLPSNQRLTDKYHKLYEKEPRKLLKMSDNKIVNEILEFFQEYYYDVFWQNIDEDTARSTLTQKLANHFGISVPELKTEEEKINFFDKKIEPALKETVTKQGFLYLGGDTQGHLGPYIWHSTEPTEFSVEIPSGEYRYTVNMMKGFVSRSWMAYISFGKIGAGGWASEDGKLNCVWKGENRLKRSAFQVDFLKHEAQHAYDFEHFDNMSAVDLEYRAKLVQLIYAVNMNSFKTFMSEASKANQKNSHVYASYMIIRNLSKAIFGVDYQSDFIKWKNKKGKIAKVALDLLNQYPKGTEKE